jgi:hypothetical protein
LIWYSFILLFKKKKKKTSLGGKNSASKSGLNWYSLKEKKFPKTLHLEGQKRASNIVQGGS